MSWVIPYEKHIKQRKSPFYLHCNLVTLKVFGPLLLLLLLPHADPDVSGQNVGVVGGLHWVRCQNKLSPMLR